jgi:hypothetical protein
LLVREAQVRRRSFLSATECHFPFLLVQSRDFLAVFTSSKTTSHAIVEQDTGQEQVLLSVLTIHFTGSNEQYTFPRAMLINLMSSPPTAIRFRQELRRSSRSPPFNALIMSFQS